MWFPNSKCVRVRRDIKFHDMPNVSTPNRAESTLWDNIPMPLEQKFRTEHPDEELPTIARHPITSRKELDSVSEPIPIVRATLIPKDKATPTEPQQGEL